MVRIFFSRVVRFLVARLVKITSVRVFIDHK